MRRALGNRQPAPKKGWQPATRGPPRGAVGKSTTSDHEEAWPWLGTVHSIFANFNGRGRTDGGTDGRTDGWTEGGTIYMVNTIEPVRCRTDMVICPGLARWNVFVSDVCAVQGCVQLYEAWALLLNPVLHCRFSSYAPGAPNPAEGTTDWVNSPALASWNVFYFSAYALCNAVSSINKRGANAADSRSAALPIRNIHSCSSA